MKTAERGASTDVEARTGAGGIEVFGVFGSLRASTGSGGIRASGNPIGDWDIGTFSGSVTLEMASEAAFDLHASTGSGRIGVERPLEVEGTPGRNELRGGGSLVVVRTRSGGITIR
jgi:DUF4097 and DUF4098 domain-containing protein YvlB